MKTDDVPAEKLPLIIYTTDDIPGIFTDENQDYITKCLIGYTKSPYRVKIYLQAANKAKAKEADKPSCYNRGVLIPREGQYGGCVF